MSDLSNKNIQGLTNSIEARYGLLLTLENVAEVLKYKTVGAVRKAHSRKTLPVPLYRFRGRSGYFAKAVEVAESIDKMEVSLLVHPSPNLSK